jgi:hypothetical protein
VVAGPKIDDDAVQGARASVPRQQPGSDVRPDASLSHRPPQPRSFAMNKKYEEQPRSRAVGVTAGSILAVMFAISLFTLVDFGSALAPGSSASAAVSTQSIA